MAQIEAMTAKRYKVRESELGGVEGGAFRVLLGIDDLKTAGKDATIYAIAQAFGDVSPKRIQHQIEKLVQLGLVTVERRRQGAFPNHLTPEGAAHLDAYEEKYRRLSAGAGRRVNNIRAAAKKLLIWLFAKVNGFRHVSAFARRKAK
jgi:DNA-binding transcriptional ArsR family regulator